MTTFKLLVDFARSHLKLSQLDLAYHFDVDVTDIKNWCRRGFPERPTKETQDNETFGVEQICSTLFFNPEDSILRLHGSSEKIISAFIRYINERGHAVDVDIKLLPNDFVLFMNEFLLLDSQKKKTPNTVELCSSGYEPIFIAIRNISNISLPDYSTRTAEDSKKCTVSRATLISLTKHCLNVDIDNELSEEYSVDELNQRIQNSNCDFIKEFSKHYRFEEKNGLVVVKALKHVDIQTDDDALFEILKTLHEAYKSYDIHSDVSGRKKIELNCTISVFINALAFRRIFNTIERRKQLCEIISSQIHLHNHDCNYLFPLLSDIKGKEKRPPLVEVGIEKVVELVGEYCNDVYLTDNNALTFITNFIETLNYYRLNEAQKVSILEKLIYDKKTYDLRLMSALMSIDKSRIITLQTYLEKHIFTLANASLTEDVRRELTAFVSMFGRAKFDHLIYFTAPTATLFQESFSDLVRFIIRKFDIIVPEDHIRRNDVANSLSCIILTMKKYDDDLAKKTMRNININKFDDYKLFKDVYDFVINNKVSVLCASEYFSEKEFLQYVRTDLLCSENPFFKEDTSLLLYSFHKIRAAIKGKNNDEVPCELKKFADDLLFWLVEATQEDAIQNRPLRYLNLIVKNPNCIDWSRKKDYDAKKMKLFAFILKNNYKSINPSMLQSIWKPLHFDTKQSLNFELQKCVRNVFEINKEQEALDFLLLNYKYLSEQNQQRVLRFVNNLNEQALSLPQLERVISFIKSTDLAQEKRKSILLSLPTLNQVSIYNKFDLFGKIVDGPISQEIALSVANGENTYKGLFDFVLKSRCSSWQRVYFKDLLSALLKIQVFLSIDANLQIQLIHYVKDKGEFYENIRTLMDGIVEKKVFSKLNSKLKTALILHCHNYIDLYESKNYCFVEFLDSILDTLTQNAYTHGEIKDTYGIKTDTLIYHILETYKDRPDKTAMLCISSICKFYKQLLHMSTEDTWDIYKQRKLSDRIDLFEVVVANPCIRNLAKYYAKKIYDIINDAQMDGHSRLANLQSLLNGICELNQWPNWFNVHPIDVCILKEDNMQSKDIKKDLFIIDEDALSNSPHDNALEELRNWRKVKNDILNPSEENQVVALGVSTGYLPISGWGMVYECVYPRGNRRDVPESIKTTVVSIAEIEPIQFEHKPKIELSCEKIIYLFENMFNELMKLVPAKAKKNGKHGKIYIKDDAYGEVDKNILPKLVAFVDFYFDFIYETNSEKPKIKPDALEAYYDYYESVEREILNGLIKKI